MASRFPSLPAGLLAIQLAGILAPPLHADSDWLDGEWVFHPRHRITDSSGPGDLATDTAGTVYFHSPLKVFADGTWESLPGGNSIEGSFFAFDRDDYWISSPEGLIRYRNGLARRFDTTNSCLEGDRFLVKGADPSGRLIVIQWRRKGPGYPTVNALRFREDSCEALTLGYPVDEGPIIGAYLADSAGRKYFAASGIQDLPACGDLLRLADGGLDTLAKGTCLYQIFSRGPDLLAQGLEGWHVFRDGVGQAFLSSLQDEPASPVTGMLLDSRQVLWIATAGERLFAIHAGPQAAGGTGDTLVFHAGNAGFPDGYPHDLVEDAHGNIWVAFSGGQFSVFARDKESLPVRPITTRPQSASSGLFSVDALGRRASKRPSHPVHSTPRRALFTAPATP